MTFEEEIVLLLKAKSPLISILSSEEERVEYALRKLMTTKLNRVVYSWDYVNGFTPNILNETCKRNPFEALFKIRNIHDQVPSLILFKDFDNFLCDLSISREIKNLLPFLRKQPKTLIFLNEQNTLPKSIFNMFVFVEFRLPNIYEIKNEIKRLNKSLDLKVEEKLIELLVSSFQGLSLEKIRHLLAKVIASKKHLDFSTINIILDEKSQLISKTEILEFWKPEENFTSIGGLNNLKSWLTKRKLHFSESAKNYRLTTPKGVLLVGVQGTGKSMTAKAIANDWGLPLLRLDIGRLFGGVVGESEKKVREMIDITESLAPCLLWIDEIEKSFANTSQFGDSGTTNRMLSTLLTWLAEKKPFVFIVATANALEMVQLELIRKGRFDEIFFLDLPNTNERKIIFEIHLKSFRPESWATYNIQELSELTSSFSGAEIKQLIIEAMYQAFSEGREFKTEDIIKEIDTTIPLAKFNQESILTLQNWLRSGRIRPASADF